MPNPFSCDGTPLYPSSALIYANDDDHDEDSGCLLEHRQDGSKTSSRCDLTFDHVALLMGL